MLLFEILLAACIVVGAIWLAGLFPWFGRACKIAFLGSWGAAIFLGPIAATLLSLDTSHAISTTIASIAFVMIFGTAYRYLGWPPLLDALRGRD